MTVLEAFMHETLSNNYTLKMEYNLEENNDNKEGTDDDDDE
jgi:hypothetical protein